MNGRGIFKNQLNKIIQDDYYSCLAKNPVPLMTPKCIYLLLCKKSPNDQFKFRYFCTMRIQDFAMKPINCVSSVFQKYIFKSTTMTYSFNFLKCYFP